MRKLVFFVAYLLFILPAQAQDVYFPPEFEKQEGLLLTWDYNDQHNPVTAAIAKAVQPSAKVWIVYYPGTAPMDTTEIRTYLHDKNVPDENIPGYRIQMVDTTLLTPLYGALHCICREITKADYLRINHAKLSGFQNYSESFQIHAEIFSIHPLNSAFVAYRKNNQPDFENVLMSLEGDNFVAELQNIAPGDTIEYYIGASANDDLVVNLPPAPQGYFTFYFDPSLRLAALNNANSRLLISPNPSSGNFQLALPPSSAQGQLMILEMSGRVVFSCEINAAKHSLNLHNTLSPGIYATVFVDQKGKNEISKLLIY